MTRITSRRQLFLGIFAALASALAVQSLVWPRWPRVAPLDGEAIERQLKAAGFRYRTLKPLPAQRSFDRAVSPVLRYALTPSQTLQVARAIARERDHFQLAFLTAAEPALKLSNRRILAGPPVSAEGRLAGSSALQTCRAGGPGSAAGYGVSRYELQPLVDRVPVDAMGRLRIVLGLRLPRPYECIVISLGGSRSQAPGTAERWQGLLQTLPAALDPVDPPR